MAKSDYPEKYSALLDEEIWAFIQRTDDYYPPDACDFTIERQREVYDGLCAIFHAGMPEGVSTQDGIINANGRDIPIRVYTKSVGGLAGAPAEVVYYHGGGFVVGGLQSHDDICAEICDRTGFRVTSIDYALAPEHHYPADYEDAVAGFEHVAAQSDLPVIVCGDSAGGNLACAVCHGLRDKARKPAGQVLIYPGLGSRLDQGSFIEHSHAPMITTSDTKFYKKIRTNGDNSLFQQATCAPLNDSDFSNLAPVFVVSAECDPLSDDSADYCAAIHKAGGKAFHLNGKGLVHGFLRARHSSKRAGRAFSQVIDAISAMGNGQENS